MRAAPPYIALALSFSLFSIGSSLHAQEWNIDAETGKIHSALDPNESGSQSFSLGLRFQDYATSVRLAGGIPTSGAEPLWGSISGSRRIALERRGFIFGADVAGNALLLHDRQVRTREIPGGGILDRTRTETLPSLSGSAFAAQALPLIGYEAAAYQVHVRAGLSHHQSTFGGQTRQRNVRLADAQVVFAPIAAFALIPAIRMYEAQEDSYRYAGMTALAGNATVSAWGSVGSWTSHDNAISWAAGSSISLHKRASINASIRHDGVDPLYRTPSQTVWNAGVSLLVGGSRPTSGLMSSRHKGGRASIRIRASREQTGLSVAGDFNDWKPAPMVRDGDEWIYTAAVQPGVYNYAFVNEQGEWFVPEKYPGRKDDGMGGHVAVLVVEP